MLRLRVATWNLREGGLDGGSAGRLDRQLALVKDYGPDVVALQEATWGDESERAELLHYAAHLLGASFRTIVASAHHGCHLAVLVRENERVKVVGEAHDAGSGVFWHALAVVELHLDGIGTVDVLNAHFAPSSPTGRRREAEALGLWKSRPALLVGDLNAMPADDPLPDLTNADPNHAHAKLDRGAAEFLRTVGFVDVGAHVADPTPTVGYTAADKLKFRCDRILFNNSVPVEHVDYQVVVPTDDEQRAGHLSDHRPVIASFTLGGTS